MLKTKFFWLGLMGTASTVLASSITISCSNSFGRYAKTDLVGLKADGSNAGEPGRISNNIINNIKQGVEQNKISKAKTIMITCAGSASDGSFNQSVWEALSQFSVLTKNTSNDIYENHKSDQTSMNKGYSYALDSGFKYWVLTGFQQEGLLKNWLSMGNNRESFIKSGIVVVGVDWNDNTNSIPKGQFLGLNFAVQEAAYVAGYASAKYAANEMPENPSIAPFGGGDFPAVTDFINGFLLGVQAYNANELASGSNKTAKIFPTSNKGDSLINLDIGFNINDVKVQEVNNIVNGNSSGKPSIIFPVTGPFTGQVLNAISSSSTKNQIVVGVDANQASAFPHHKNYIATSVEKLLGVTVYQALAKIYLTNLPPEETPITLIPELQNFSQNFEIYKQSDNQYYGYKEGAIGTSLSTLGSDKEVKFNSYLDEVTKITIPGITPGYIGEFNKLIKAINAQHNTAQSLMLKKGAN